MIARDKSWVLYFKIMGYIYTHTHICIYWLYPIEGCTKILHVSLKFLENLLFTERLSTEFN